MYYMTYFIMRQCSHTLSHLISTWFSFPFEHRYGTLLYSSIFKKKNDNLSESSIDTVTTIKQQSIDIKRD